MQLSKYFGIGISVVLVISGLSGCNNGDSGLLGGGAPKKEIVTDSSLVSIDGNSADNQSFPVGLSKTLTFTTEFTDGSDYSTEDAENDADFMSWTIEGDTGATITTEGVLDTTNVAPGTTLTITATGKMPYEKATDSITVLVSDATVVDGSALVSIDGNSADGQSFPVGIPVQMTAQETFTDGITYTTNSETDSRFMEWSVSGSPSAIISSEGVLDTTNVAQNTELVITATGKMPYDSETDSITVLVSDATVVDGSALVSIDGNSADGQSFPVGIPVQLTAEVGFSDGSTYSTDDSSDDSSVMSWSIAGSTGATISEEGLLNTSGVLPGTTLTITATGKMPYDSETDSIIVLVSDATVVDGSALVSIDGNSADGQSFPVGIPVQLTAEVGFSDGSTYSTDDSSDDSSVMSWSIAGSTGATISEEGLLNTSGVLPGTTLTITATGKMPYDSETDSIIVLVSDATVVDGSALVSIDGNSADGQSFPVGIPVQMTAQETFTDGITYTTNSETDSRFMSWSIAGSTGATISEEGLLNTSGVLPGTTLTITATGKMPYDSETDSIIVLVSDATVVDGSALVSIDGNSADGQSFPAGIPVQLTAEVGFSDGSTYSTDDSSDDSSVMSWSIAGSTGATISEEGLLNTSGVLPGTTLTITATGKMPYDSETDSIIVLVSDATVVDGSALVSIDGNSADGQSFPAGIPVQLTAEVGFSDGSTYSTDDSSDDSSVMSWSIAGSTGATISEEGLLNTSGVLPGTTLTITATGKMPYDSETDSIIVLVSDATVVDGSALVSIAPLVRSQYASSFNSDDNQEFLSSEPLQLAFSVELTNGEMYSTLDGTSDNAFMNWKILGSTDATISEEGVLNAREVTPGTTLTITATGLTPNDSAKDEIIVKILDPLKVCGTQTDDLANIDDTDPSSASEICLKVASTADDSWFTSTPNIDVIRKLSVNSWFSMTLTENGSRGPSNVTFGRAQQDIEKHNGLGEGTDFDNWCNYLALTKFAGREGWRRPSLDELKKLYGEKGDMWSNFGWPTGTRSWTSTPFELSSGEIYMYQYSLANGVEQPVGTGINSYYASCISDD
ncbi:hypothetical protein [Vibrio jasicida]|uniref:BIG2 domain-containing protein n=1 Tax=Vibrio jasicida TaxID=766224 RepID=A0ABW7JHA4_9VIBR